MLFGVPVALLAAIYSSEMMHARTRARVKPIIEMMASLPSVVLGFLAALVVAPFIEDIVTESLVCFATVPFGILLGAHLWQTLPRRFATRNEKYRIFIVGLSIAVGVWLAFLAGPAIERMLFAGDIKVWLDGQVGDGTGAWVFILLPLSCLTVGFVSVRVLNPWIRARSGGWTPLRVAGIQLISFLGLSVAAAALAYTSSYLHDFGGRAVRGTRPLAHGVAGGWRHAVADRDADRHSHGGQRAVFRRDDRVRPGDRRDHDRANGGGQYTGDGLERF
jgi:phosphate transport system permease protein